MNAPKLSIATVVRNSLSPLQTTIDSLRSQTDRSFEYAIIDGASTDETREFVLQRPSPATIVLSEPDEGIYSAMNKAPAICSGAYLQYLNAGDRLWDRQTLAAILPYLDGEADLVLFNYMVLGNRYQADLSLRRVLGGGHCHQAIFYRRQYLLDHPFDTDLKYSADYHHLLNAISSHSVRVAEPIAIDYDTTGISSQASARRRIRLERAWSAWHSGLTMQWRLTIAGYNLLRVIR